jgi:hypothetical protein
MKAQAFTALGLTYVQYANRHESWPNLILLEGFGLIFNHKEITETRTELNC